MSKASNLHTGPVTGGARVDGPPALVAIQDEKIYRSKEPLGNASLTQDAGKLGKPKIAGEHWLPSLAPPLCSDFVQSTQLRCSDTGSESSLQHAFFHHHAFSGLEAVGLPFPLLSSQSP